MKPLPWSFSAIDKFKNCPYAFYKIKVVKTVKEPQGEEAKWGTYVHKCAENYIAHGRALPDNVVHFKPQIDACLAWAESVAPLVPGETPLVRAEYQIALAKDLKPTAWFASDVADGRDPWNRCALDYLRISGSVAAVADWKTGAKKKPDNRQLALFALVIFYVFPEVNEVHTSFEWLALQDKTRPDRPYTRRDIPTLWSIFLADLTIYAKAFKEDVWQKRQSGLCKKHCHVLDCEFNGRNGQ